MSINEEGFLSPDIALAQQKIREPHESYFRLFDQLNRFCHQKKFMLEVHSKDLQEIFASGLF